MAVLHDKSGLHVTTLPKQTEAGNPDFRVWDGRARIINREQYFDNIPEPLWAYRIGGYQVLDKWLKDRAERRLSPAEVKHYCRTATALAETMKVEERLGALYPRVEAETLAMRAMGSMGGMA